MEKIKEKIQKIMLENQIEVFGAIPFSSIDHLIKCRGLGLIPKEARSVLLLLIPYNIGETARRNISKYAVSKDYHLIARELLERIILSLREIYPKEEFIGFADSSPIPEVASALRAGLGARGDNGLLINEIYGSYCFIAEIVSTAILPYNEAEPKECLHCGLCQKNCPGKALAPRELDEGRCVSAISQKKGELSKDEIALIKRGGLVWGCDICQDVCPLNKGVKLTPIRAFYETALPYITKENVSDAIKTRAFCWRGIGTIKRNIEILGEDNLF